MYVTKEADKKQLNVGGRLSEMLYDQQTSYLNIVADQTI